LLEGLFRILKNHNVFKILLDSFFLPPKIGKRIARMRGKGREGVGGGGN